jgi:hypothetical protein
MSKHGSKQWSKTMTTKYGETDWNENSGSGGGKAEFLRLSEGENRFRVITKPFKYSTHKNVKPVDEKGYGRKVPCSANEETGETCPLCEMGHKAKRMYMLGVIDRKTDTYKVIDISWSIFSPIKGFVNDPIWGPPESFDIKVKKNPHSTGPSDFYLVSPIPHTPLSIDDQQKRDTADTEYLKSKTTPMARTGVEKILEKVLAGGALFIPPVEERMDNKQPARSTRKASTVPHTEIANSVEDDLDDSFPNYGQGQQAQAN